MCVTGAAGCVATLLHDAAMNPAEGIFTLISTSDKKIKIQF